MYACTHLLESENDISPFLYNAVKSVRLVSTVMLLGLNGSPPTYSMPYSFVANTLFEPTIIPDNISKAANSFVLFFILCFLCVLWPL